MLVLRTAHGFRPAFVHRMLSLAKSISKFNICYWLVKFINWFEWFDINNLSPFVVLISCLYMSHEKEEPNHLGCKVYFWEAQIPGTVKLLLWSIKCIRISRKDSCD
jgi:hypothetical protein